MKNFSYPQVDKRSLKSFLRTDTEKAKHFV